MVEYLFADKMEKKVGKVTATHFGNLHYFTSEGRTLEERFLNDPANSRLFEEPGSDTEHNLEYEQEPVPRKRKLQPNKKAAKKTVNNDVSANKGI